MPVPREVTDAIGRLLPALLETLDRVEWVQRRLFPPHAAALADELAPFAERVREPLGVFIEAPWPPELEEIRDRLADVAGQALALVTAFVDAARSSGDVFEIYRALRRFSRLQEALYPLAAAFGAVSRWFIEPARRGDDELVEQRRRVGLADATVPVGVLHAANERRARGGFSAYVPEEPAATPMPLIVALHGGHGHGRDFLWTWVREARTRRALVLAPTSRERTWSLMGPDDVDAENVCAAVDWLAGRYPVDRRRVLLTGMSDGATYAFLLGLREGMPFTHLAPACGVLHPQLLLGGGLARARGRPIYLVHGTLDWMFPVQTAQMAREALESVGARLVYRELADLSHTYPRDENPRILDWLAASP